MIYSKPDTIAKCRECTLNSQPGPCWGSGNPETAKLIYIAQNPGEHETNARPMEPLIGPSGRVFNRQLSEAGIKRSDVFITNQVKCLTPNNREPTQQEVECCRPLIELELGRCRSDVVVLAGSTAFEANIGDWSTLHPDYHPSTSIFERMGCVEQRGGRKWIGTPHPAYIMRFSGTPVKDEAVDHLRKAYKLSGVNIPLPRVITSPTDEDVQRHKEAARRGGIFADDIEALKTVSEEVTDEDEVGREDWKMDMCGFSAIPYEAIVLDTSQLGLWEDIWGDDSLLQCEHNGESDRFYLEQVSPQRNKRYDTMLAHHLLHNNIHKYLKPEVLRLYTNLPYFNRDLEPIDRKLYNGMDCITTYLATIRQLALMKNDVYVDVWGTEGERGRVIQSRLYDLYFGRAFPGEPGLGRILPILEEQRRKGLRVDLRKALLFHHILQYRKEYAEKLISDLLGPLFNWRSYGPNGDVQRLFYGKWKLPPQYNKDKKTHKEKLTCDAKAREAMKEWVNDDNYPSRKEDYAEAIEYFALADEAAESSKLLEYISRIDRDGRVHAMQKAHGTATFRIASKPNTQNWPTWGIGKDLPSMRSMVLPDSDEDLLLVCDFDQVELWTYAAQFGIRYLLDVYESGAYLYGEVAEEFYGRKFFNDEGPRRKWNRRPDITDSDILDFKELPLGLQYGARADRMAKRRGWSIEVAQARYDEWKRRNPELYKAHDWINYTMEQKGVLRPPPGMKLHFPEPDLQGLNCFGQTPSAVLLWTSMILIDDALKSLGEGDRITLSVHDAIAVNVRRAAIAPERMIQVHDSIVHPILSRPIQWLNGFRYRHSSKVGSMWDWGMEEYDKWIKTQSSRLTTSSPS